MFTTTATLPGIRMFWRRPAHEHQAQGLNFEAVPRMLTVADACAALRVSRWSLYQLIRTRKLASVKIGSRRLIPATAIHEFVDGLRDEGAL